MLSNTAITSLLLALLVFGFSLILYSTVYNLFSSLAGVERTPDSYLFLEGYTQDENTVCIALHTSSENSVNEPDALLIFKQNGSVYETREVNIHLESNSFGRVCVKKPSSGEYEVEIKGSNITSTSLKISVCSISDVNIYSGVYFDGSNKNRYTDKLFFGDYNRVIIQTNHSTKIKVRGDCIKPVECLGFCETSTTRYGDCSIVLECGQGVTYKLNKEVWQLKECNSTASCTQALDNLDDGYFGVIVVKPRRNDAISLSSAKNLEGNYI